MNIDRSFTLLKNTRTRLHSVAAAAALALMVGLSAPATAEATASTAEAERREETVAKVQAAAPAIEAALTADAAAPAAAPVAAAAAASPAPSLSEMHPTGIAGAQQGLTPNAEQMKNARAIIETGQAMGLPPRAWVIAVATALQESTLHNYGNLGANNDHDSLGLFQQRPSSGWGSPGQIMNPTYAARAFYKGLIGVPNWDKRPLTEAAQAVQVSAFPNHYAKWEAQAADLVQAFYFNGPLAHLVTG